MNIFISSYSLFLERLTWIQFEEYLTTFFEISRFFVKKNPLSHDYGADLIINKFGDTTAMQVKGQRQPVGINAVQEVAAARDWYFTQKALVVITSSFAKSAVQLANRLGVELWDRKQLMGKIRNHGFKYGGQTL